MIQWHTQAGNTNTNIKAEIDFALTELSATNFMTWNFRVGDSAKGRYAMGNFIRLYYILNPPKRTK